MMLNFMGDDESGQGVMLEHNRLLQQALEIGDKLKIEGGDREALSSTPPTTIASMSQSFLQRALEDDRIKSELADREAITMTQAGGGALSGGNSSSSPPNDRSPSPNLIKYAQRSHSLTPSPPSEPGDDEYEDQVEDLSMARKPDQHSRVIMPPMNQASAAMLATCSEGRRD